MGERNVPPPAPDWFRPHASRNAKDNPSHFSGPLRRASSNASVRLDHTDQQLKTTDVESFGAHIHYVLPLRWSLHYALTNKQWNSVRERFKQLDPSWESCSCPKRCTANSLDEKWNYDHERHTKTFRGAAFVCRGCHWLKSPPWRVQTWLKDQDGKLAPLSKQPHIVHCLGWTQQQVDDLRRNDLETHKIQAKQVSQMEVQIRQGQAAVVPSPVDRLTPKEHEELVNKEATMIAPWRVDLSTLQEFGFSTDDIGLFEKRMYKLASKRMATFAALPDAVQ